MNMPELKTLRDWLAIVVVVVSVVAICIVASIAVYTARETSEVAKLIFSALLPLLGTWVGTVLAFYFSKENYQVAADFAKQTFLTAQDRLSPIPVRSAMIHVNRITAHEIAAAADFDAAKLSDVKAAMGAFKRIPVWDKQKIIVAVVHNEPLVSFLFEAAANEALKASLKKAPADVTFGDVKQHRRALYDDVTQLIAFVPESASLADAKKAMEDKGRCQDVFVTQKGTSKEAVLGWITNNEISDLLRA